LNGADHLDLRQGHDATRQQTAHCVGRLPLAGIHHDDLPRHEPSTHTRIYLIILPI
jgi:hypothetical protein